MSDSQFVRWRTHAAIHSASRMVQGAHSQDRKCEIWQQPNRPPGCRPDCPSIALQQCRSVRAPLTSRVRYRSNRRVRQNRALVRRGLRKERKRKQWREEHRKVANVDEASDLPFWPDADRKRRPPTLCNENVAKGNTSLAPRNEAIRPAC